MTKSQEQLNLVRNYHELSKHQPGKYAKGPDSLDWDMQPDPFREFQACKRIALPLTANQLEHTLGDILTPSNVATQTFSKESIGQLLEVSMGLSAWKVYGSDRWSLRCNPSSGNLHPTETYVITNTISDMESGVYHYQSHQHCLEQRSDLTVKLEMQESILPPQCILIGLSSIHWRESWKYGVRAYRYCQLDLGHAIASIRYAAALQGWKIHLIRQASDRQVSQILGIDREQDFHNCEMETADILLLIDRNGQTDPALLDMEWIVTKIHTSEWNGSANVLSPHGRMKWPEIDKVSEACNKPATTPMPLIKKKYNSVSHTHKDLNASQLLRQRRSAQAFDSQTELPTEDFYQMLSAISTDHQTLPLDCWNDVAHIHPVFYVHRVKNVAPGLYALPRSTVGMALMRENFRDQFVWQKPESCPDDIPLYMLVRANCRNAARTLSCHQDIASASAFCVSLLAEFDTVLTDSPWKYRDLFYEAGVVGQALYIEAEAAGIRGTGIGCFFDDTIHETFGIQNRSLQCVYNFTVGMPVVDNRLISLPPYSHLQVQSRHLHKR